VIGPSDPRSPLLIASKVSETWAEGEAEGRYSGAGIDKVEVRVMGEARGELMRWPGL